MWSKQADTRDKQKGGKNSHRKRKNDKSKQQQQQQQVQTNGKCGKPKPQQQQQQQGGKKKSQPDLIENLVPPPTDSVDGVVLRKKEPKSASGDVKRYSDSFVIDSTGVADEPKLSRAHSGFFLENGKEKKSRRFSDLFRNSSSIKTESAQPETNNRKKSTTVAPIKDEAAATANSSVLRRVRSKIYKHKNENGVSAAPTMPDISEKTGEYRLVRQTSNLERITPFAHKKTNSADGASLYGNGEPPKLAKSKSSSAINLSLLRTRRNKIFDYRKTCRPVQDEFDFIAFGGLDVITTRNEQATKLTRSFLDAERRDCETRNDDAGEARPGNPVTRTPSDRRPDAVREESSRLQDAQSNAHNDSDAANPESSVSLPASTGNKKRHHSNINRSESVKESSEKKGRQRRNASDPLHTTSETVDLDQSNPFHPHSGSSSNSSLSSRSLESPSSNAEVVSDSDLEVETDPPDWKSNLTEEQLARLHPDEKKRQDVINELFHTERSHVRNLKVLDQIFRKNILENRALTDAEMKLVFANLVELLSLHNQFNTAMKNKRKENPIVTDVGNILLNMFDGETGNSFCTAAAKFCEKQQLALEFIKEKRRKDSKFEAVLTTCEKNNHCRRLPLQGFLPQEMQRLSKYPLLLERLIDTEEKIERPEGGGGELEKLTLALEKSREILNRVNEAAKLAYNKARLEEIKNHLYTVDFERVNDHSAVNEFKNLDWMQCTLIHEGTVTLKRQNKTPVQVHLLLLEEAVILLQREGERFVLKFFHGGNQPLAPIIRMPNVICRKNAADEVTLFLVSNTHITLHSQMYEIQCRDAAERRTWFRYLTEVSEPYKLRDGKGKRVERSHDPEEEAMQDLAASASRPETGDAPVTTEIDSAASSAVAEQAAQEPPATATTTEEPKRLSQGDGVVVSLHSAAGDGVSIKMTPNDWPLIQPSEVQVASPPVHTAEPVLTLLEQIKRKDEEVKQALADKKVLVADLLSIPHEDYELIADIASDEAVKKAPSEREPSELVLASMNQVDQLLAAVNNSMNVSETDAVLTTGGKHPACTSNELNKCDRVPSVPATDVQEIATTLYSQLTVLLGVVKEMEDNKEKWRKEANRLREQLHVRHNLHGPQSVENDESVQHDSVQSGDLESIEESPTETETT